MARLSPEDVIAALVQRGVPQHIAEGVALNFQDESGLNTGIQERSPSAGRGGFGIAQWTGPRRVALERYAGSKGKPADDPGVQFDFFMLENAGSEADAWKQVLASKTKQDAAINFVNKWERPRGDLAAARSKQYSHVADSAPAAADPAPAAANPATAAYPDSPSEGGGRFGGIGLGTPGYGDSPSESGGARFGGGGLDATSTPETAFGAPAASQSPFSLKGSGDKISEALSGAFKGMGGKAAVLGEGGNAPQLPTMAPQAQAQQPFVSGGANEQGYRDAMAMLMARLNSPEHKIWG